MVNFCAFCVLFCSVIIAGQNPSGRPESSGKPKKPISRTREAIPPLSVILTVLTDPPGSQVFINGESKGSSNAGGKIQFDKLPLGHYEVEVRKDGFIPMKRGFEAGRESPTLVFKLSPDFDEDARELNSLLESGKLNGPDTPNAFDFVISLSSKFPGRPEVEAMRAALFQKYMDLSASIALRAISAWREVKPEELERGRDSSAGAVALRSDDKPAQAREVFFQGMLALRAWEVGSLSERTPPPAEAETDQSKDKKREEESGPDRARSLLEKAVQLDDSWAIGRYQLGSILLIIGDISSAETHLIKAAELEPRWALSHAQLGTSYYAGKKYKESIAEFQKAIDLDANLSTAFAGRGLARCAKGDVGAGLKDAQHAMELDPSSALPHFSLGIIYAQSKKAKDLARAEEELKLAMEKNPYNLEFQNSAARSMLANLEKRKKK